MKNCIKDKSLAQFDIVSLGEVMLRLDPGEDRIRTARTLRVWEGGGEYNVARGLKKCFGLRAGLVSAFAKNEVGYLIEDFIMQGGVNMDFVKWVKADGAGRKVRNGLNFTERGYGIRGALGCSDRGNSAASQLKPGDIDWESLFGDRGVRWFHTGGIFAALSETTGEVVLEAAKAAKKHGTIVSYDLNYRPSLWADIGGQARAVEINSEIAKYGFVIFAASYASEKPERMKKFVGMLPVLGAGALALAGCDSGAETVHPEILSDPSHTASISLAWLRVTIPVPCTWSEVSSVCTK